MASLEPLGREGRDELEGAGDGAGGLSPSSRTGTTAPAAASSGPATTAPSATSTGKASTCRAATSTETATTAPATMVTQITSVFDNSDLLSEILLRVVHPHCLIRAAAVSKFWFLNAFDPVFLQNFQKRNPLSVLGYYVMADRLLHPRFVPCGVGDSYISPLLNLATSQFDVWEDIHVIIWDCKNGKLLVEIGDKLEVRNFLCRPCSIAAYPQSPLKVILNKSFTYQHHEFLPHNGGDGHEYYHLALGHNGGFIIACLSLLCGHIWSNRISNVIALPQCAASTDFAVPYGKLGNRMLYLVTTCGLVIILDIDTMEMLMVEVPDELVVECYDLDLCPGQSDFKFYLLGLSQSNLHIWYHDASGNSSDTWQPLHCIPIPDIFGDLMWSSVEQMDLADGLKLWGVGDQAEFVLLEAGNAIYHFNIETKKLTEAFELQAEDGELQGIFPCMMVWPPIVPLSMRAYEPNGRSSRQSIIQTETVSWSVLDVVQGGQKHGPETLRPATRARRQLIMSEEGGQDYASANDFLSVIAEAFERVGDCNTADASGILSSGQDRIQIEALRQELVRAKQQIEALKTEKALLEAEAYNQHELAVKLESDLKISSDADLEVNAQFEDEREDSQVKLNYLLFCLDQEQSWVKELSRRLTELGEDGDTLPQGICE